MDGFSELFVFTIHAHFVAFVVHMAALFENSPKTINLQSLAKEVKDRSPALDRVEVDALLKEAEPLTRAVKILRNNLFAHRSAFVSYASAFEMAHVTADQLRDLTEIALRIANQLLLARRLPGHSFNPGPNEHADALLKALLRDHAAANP
jgi:hypothetical protein